MFCRTSCAVGACWRWWTVAGGPGSLRSTPAPTMSTTSLIWLVKPLASARPGSRCPPAQMLLVLGSTLSTAGARMFTHFGAHLTAHGSRPASSPRVDGARERGFSARISCVSDDDVAESDPASAGAPRSIAVVSPDDGALLGRSRTSKARWGMFRSPCGLSHRSSPAHFSGWPGHQRQQRLWE